MAKLVEIGREDGVWTATVKFSDGSRKMYRFMDEGVVEVKGVNIWPFQWRSSGWRSRQLDGVQDEKQARKIAAKMFSTI